MEEFPKTSERISRTQWLVSSITSNWISGVQWLFFIFTNIVVIPITVGAAFDLPSVTIVSMLQLSFIVTGIACILQALFGHQRAIMEGQSGLWWGIILTLANTAVARGTSLNVLGGSIAVGVILSGVITILIGITGLGPLIARLFNPGVMGVFMFLFAVQLLGIFLKGMLGIPFGNVTGTVSIEPCTALLSIAIAVLVMLISIKGSDSVRKYALLIGIIIGWIAHTLIFGSNSFTSGQAKAFSYELFPFGNPAFNLGIIITIVLTGLLDTANTFGALKGTNSIYKKDATKKQYRNSFTITGMVTSFSGMFGLVPYSPYVSSVGFLYQTGVYNRMPFIIGGFMFFMMGVIPSIGAFFSLLPLSVGSAVLFVSYLQIVVSSRSFFSDVNWNFRNVYRSAIPLFVGIIIMTMPAEYFNSLPEMIRPLLRNGLIVGITLAIILESLIEWDNIE